MGGGSFEITSVSGSDVDLGEPKVVKKKHGLQMSSKNESFNGVTQSTYVLFPHLSTKDPECESPQNFGTKLKALIDCHIFL